MRDIGPVCWPVPEVVCPTMFVSAAPEPPPA
jgi:hypothetical protein